MQSYFSFLTTQQNSEAMMVLDKFMSNADFEKLLITSQDKDKTILFFENFCSKYGFTDISTKQTMLTILDNGLSTLPVNSSKNKAKILVISDLQEVIDNDMDMEHHICHLIDESEQLKYKLFFGVSSLVFEAHSVDLRSRMAPFYHVKLSV